MFGETTISQVKIWTHPIETTTKQCLFRLFLECLAWNNFKGSSWQTDSTQKKTRWYAIALDIQTHSEKVFGPPKCTQNTFSGGIWMSRVVEEISWECGFPRFLTEHFSSNYWSSTNSHGAGLIFSIAYTLESKGDAWKNSPLDFRNIIIQKVNIGFPAYTSWFPTEEQPRRKLNWCLEDDSCSFKMVPF